MKSENELKSKASSNCDSNDGNTIVIEVDKSVPKDPIKLQKNKIYEQVPIEESVEQYDTIESKSCCSQLKSCLNYLDNLDKKISKPLQIYTPNFAIECIFFVFSKLFNTETVIIYLFILLICSYLKNHNFYLFLIPFIHVVIGAILTGLLKIIIGRNRPVSTVKRFCNYVRDKETSKSMPSGDSLQSANFAMMAILYFNCNMKYLVLLLIPGVMCGRVYYNCHYWFDCIIGVVLGIFVSIGSYIIINKINLHI